MIELEVELLCCGPARDGKQRQQRHPAGVRPGARATARRHSGAADDGAGAELLVSAFRDPDFGVMVSLGAGRTLTELIDDVVLVPAPLGPASAEHALRRLRVMRKVGDQLGAVVDFVCRFSVLAAVVPWRRFVLEVNPVKWTPGEATAVDGLLIISDPATRHP